MSDVPTIDEEFEFIRWYGTMDAAFFVAVDDAKIVANLALSAYQRPQTAHAAVAAMSVLEPHRGQDIESRLIDTAIEWGQH